MAPTSNAMTAAAHNRLSWRKPAAFHRARRVDGTAGKAAGAAVEGVAADPAAAGRAGTSGLGSGTLLERL